MFCMCHSSRHTINHKASNCQLALQSQRKKIVDHFVIILDDETLLMQAKITLVFLAVSLLCGFYWVCSQLKFLRTVFGRWLCGNLKHWTSWYFLPFIDSSFLAFVLGSEPRNHDIDNINIF